MTFKKIDENTIRCVLTESDMEENDIGLADFSQVTEIRYMIFSRI